MSNYTIRKNLPAISGGGFLLGLMLKHSSISVVISAVWNRSVGKFSVSNSPVFETDSLPLLGEKRLSLLVADPRSAIVRADKQRQDCRKTPYL